MGLDISLARIAEHEVNEFGHLFVEEQPELFTRFQHYIRKKHFVYPDEEYDSEVYFYAELAHQSGGMIAAFYINFINDVCLTEQHQVARLVEYVRAEYKADFDTCFVNEFIEGQTFVIIGW